MKKKLYAGVTLFLIFTIVYLSIASVPAGPSISGFDKLGHGAAYMVLALFLSLSLREWGLGIRGVYLTLLICAFLGGGLEIVQSQVGRAMEWADFAADLVGAVLGILTARLFSLVVLKTRKLHRR